MDPLRLAPGTGCQMLQLPLLNHKTKPVYCFIENPPQRVHFQTWSGKITHERHGIWGVTRSMVQVRNHTYQYSFGLEVIVIICLLKRCSAEFHWNQNFMDIGCIKSLFILMLIECVLQNHSLLFASTWDTPFWRNFSTELTFSGHWC